MPPSPSPFPLCFRQVKAAAQKAGDLGEVAQHSTNAQGTLSFGQTIKSLSAKQVQHKRASTAGFAPLRYDVDGGITIEGGMMTS